MDRLRAISRRIQYRVQHALRYFPSVWQLPNPCKTLEFIELTRVVPLRAGQRVLDLGCGQGLQTQLLARRGPNCIGVDISEAIIGRARSALSLSFVRSRVEFFAGSISEARIPTASIDYVFSFCVLEHIALLEQALAEVHRALVPRGELHATVDALTTITDATLLETHRTKYSVCRYFRPDDLRALLDGAGFDVFELRYILSSERAAAQLSSELRGESPTWPVAGRRRGLAALMKEEATMGSQPDGGLMILFRARKR